MIKKYVCDWCNYEFEQEVEYKLGSKKYAHSTKVVCPNCGRTIQTWKRESTGELVGKKHIHIRR